MPHRPLLFLDVDGPLIPYAVGEGRPSPGYAPLRLGGARRWLNPRHGAALLALPYRPVWATTWEHDANEVLAPLLGLPELPVVEWPDGAPAYGRTHFKTAVLLDYAAGRPFAWVDDEITDGDRDFTAEHHAAPALLHRVAPALGLGADDFAALARWAGRLTRD